MCQGVWLLLLRSPPPAGEEVGWVSTLMSGLWRWERSWIFILHTLQKHLLLSFDGVGLRTTHLSSAGSPVSPAVLGGSLLPTRAAGSGAWEVCWRQKRRVFFRPFPKCEIIFC